MPPVSRFCFLFLLLLAASCRQAPRLIIGQQRALSWIPSGSGMTADGAQLLFVGDDGTGIYVTDSTFGSREKLPIPGIDPAAAREERFAKHDLEASVLVPAPAGRCLLAFGSGSVSPQRDSLLIYPLTGGAPRFRSLRPLYNELQARSGALAWNIEGAALAGTELVLLNRAGNQVFRIPLDAFLRYIEGGPLPAVKVARTRLPEIGGHEARFSGAAAIDRKRILFSASVEATEQWNKDGAVLGSFVGVYDLEAAAITALAPLVDARGQRLLQKIESVEIRGAMSGNSLPLWAIADNDDGTTTFFELLLKDLR
ncbi:MAG: hypothetical protein EOO16_03545 [Chitinophagaceae bacterium]|nr:MAG: hypothetical protein EOO16_03545 [Chitinophagaceae bacterium]